MKSDEPAEQVKAESLGWSAAEPQETIVENNRKPAERAAAVR